MVRYVLSLTVSVVCGAILALPFRAYDGSAPAWFALAPMFWLVARTARLRWAAAYAGAFALTWTGLSFAFLWHLTIPGTISLTLYTALFYVAALLAIRNLACHSPAAAIVGTAALWALVELLRAVVPVLGFPWLLLGHTLLYNEPLRQNADLLGVYGLSFLMAAVNASLAFALPAFLPADWQAMRNVSRAGAAKTAALVASLLAGAFVYGEVRIAGITPRLTAGPPIGVIQGNVAQKLGRTDEQLAAQLQQHLELHRQLARPAEGGEKPALICWAETMVPGSLNYSDWGTEFTREIGLAGIPTLAGANYWVSRDNGLPESEGYYHNAAFILDANGNELGRYYKRRLVAFGEYIPFVRQLPFLKMLRSITRDQYMPGVSASPVVRVPPHARPDEPVYRMALNICVEDIHPDLAREAARDGADTLVNVTNDGWFYGNFGPRAHMQAAAWRAIEVRRPLLRVTNTGHTVAVDPLGRITLLVPLETVGTCIVRLERIAPSPGSQDGPWTWTLWLGDAGTAAILFGVLLASLAAGKRRR